MDIENEIREAWDTAFNLIEAAPDPKTALASCFLALEPEIRAELFETLASYYCPQADTVPLPRRKELVEIGAQIGEHYAQSLYHIAVFLTRVAKP